MDTGLVKVKADLFSCRFVLLSHHYVYAKCSSHIQIIIKCLEQLKYQQMELNYNQSINVSWKYSNIKDLKNKHHMLAVYSFILPNALKNNIFFTASELWQTVLSGSSH